MNPLIRVLAGVFASAIACFPARAQYPLQASFFPATQQPGGGHGFSVAADATYVVVGAPLTDIAGVQDAGVAVVYSAATGALVATLLNPSPASGDQFGCAVAVSGERVVVGARYDDTGASDAGAAYVYDLSSATPTTPVETLSHPAGVDAQFAYSVGISGSLVVVGSRVAKYRYDLSVSPPASYGIASIGGGGFGGVAISGTRAVLGAPTLSSGGAPGAGQAFVYDVSAEPPVAVATLNNPSPGLNDNFGNAVAIDGTRVVIGASLDNPNFSTDAGSAYLYDLAGETPTAPVATLPNPAPATGDQFGATVAIAGAKVLIGAGLNGTGNTSSDVADRGTTYLYDVAGASTPIFTFENPEPAIADYFGGAVALAGDHAVVGASGNDAGGADTGSALLYDVTTVAQPVVVTTLPPALNPSPAINDEFGISVAVSGDLMVVGAFFHDVVGATDTGAAYVYDLSNPRPTVPIAILNNPSASADDYFGIAVAIDGKRVVVGAYGDDMGATNAGRAYVFDLASNQPTVPIATLNHPNPIADDYFGHAVAISGHRVVVGTCPTLQINSNAERTYIYDVTSATPTAPIGSLISPTPGGQGGFGFSVAISGTRVLVSEPYDGEEQFGINPGTVHVFDLNSPPPSVFVATLTNPNPRIGHFGQAVAMSGSRVVIGAWIPSSSALPDGAAYVYNLESGPPFATEFTLDHPDPAHDGLYGYAVSIAGSRVVVGEHRNDTGANDAGAAWVFDLGGPSPLVPTLVPNPTPAFFDEFGGAVAASANRVIVAASSDDTLNTDQGAAYVFGAPVGPPEIAVEQPAGTPLVDGAGSVSFGTVVSGQTSERTFTVRNTGIGDLTGFGLTFVGAGGDEFVVTAAPTAPVAGPSGSTTFTVRFAPQFGGPKNATLRLASNDADENPFDIALTGTALTRLEGWRLFYFGSIANAGDGADNNDFDRDGLVNLLEFATLREPTQFSGPIGVFSREVVPPPQPPDPPLPPRERLKFIYQRATAAVLDGIFFSVDRTNDLTDLWLANVPQTTLSDDGTVQVVEASVVVPVAEPIQGQRFMRLRVSRP